MMEELDRFIAELERDVERSVRDILSSRKFLARPMVYGFSMRIGPDGHPEIRTFGDRRLPAEGYREPVYDQIVDEGRGELKVVAELPGIEKQDVELTAAETEAAIRAVHGERKYQAEIPLRAAVDPASAQAKYHNGILEVTFKLKDKANKGFTKISIE